MILSTTNSIENFSIVNYLGIVSAIKVQLTQTKISFKQDVLNKSIEKNISIAKEEAFQKIVTQAKKLKANAIVGIKVDIEIANQFSKVCVSVTGTAVKVIQP